MTTPQDTSPSHTPGIPPDAPPILIRKGAPAGALHIVHLQDMLIWTGDVRFFREYGEAQFRAAWHWLGAQKAATERDGHTVLSIAKDFDGDVHLHTEFKRRTPPAFLTAHCYAPPPLPAGWQTPPGIYLADYIRRQIRAAHEAVRERDAVVYDDALRQAIQARFDDDPLLSGVSVRCLWRPDRWLETLGLSAQPAPAGGTLQLSFADLLGAA